MIANRSIAAIISQIERQEAGSDDPIKQAVESVLSEPDIEEKPVIDNVVYLKKRPKLQPPAKAGIFGGSRDDVMEIFGATKELTDEAILHGFLRGQFKDVLKNYKPLPEKVQRFLKGEPVADTETPLSGADTDNETPQKAA